MSNTNALSAKDRIAGLVDENSFVEIGAGITKRSTDFNMQEKSVPSDGVITGYGLIQNNPVYVYSQDASALNGTIGEMHARKIAHIYELAMKTGVPVIGLCRNAFTGGNRCTCRIWSDLPDESKSIWCSTADQCNLWQLWWWCCSDGCYE